MSSPACVARAPAPLDRPALRAARDVVERQEQAGQVAHRGRPSRRRSSIGRIGSPSKSTRTKPSGVRRIWPRWRSPWIRVRSGGSVQRLEAREPAADRRRPGPQVGADGRVVGEQRRSPRRGAPRRRPARRRRSSGVGAARREGLDLARVGQAAWSSARTCAELGGVLGRVLERDLARGDDPVGQPLGGRLDRRPPRPARAPGAWPRVATDAVAADVLGRAGQRRDEPEPALLGQEGGQLEVRVETRLDPAIRLEQEPLAEDRRRVRLVGAERRSPHVAISRAPPGANAGSASPGRQTSAPPASRAEDPAAGDRHGQRPPDAVARHGLAGVPVRIRRPRRTGAR